MVGLLMLVAHPLHLTELFLRQSKFSGHQSVHVLLYELPALLRELHLVSVLFRQGYYDVEVAFRKVAVMVLLNVVHLTGNLPRCVAV